jgi:acetate kinase
VQIYCAAASANPFACIEIRESKYAGMAPHSCGTDLAVNILVLNPGSNSLKAGIVTCRPGQRAASAGAKLVEIIVEGIGKQAKLSVYEGKKLTETQPLEAADFNHAAAKILDWLDQRGQHSKPGWQLSDIAATGVRVVHGGAKFSQPTPIDADVEREIEELAKWAPLHNHRSLEILPALKHRLRNTPLFAVFDTAFHRTIPDHAGLYAIPLALAHKHGVRRYGFHGISHRFLMDRYAEIANREPRELNLVTMHLESGCSVTAIRKGQSVDNTMGLTPLEGLMMGTRSGDVDPALVPFLAQAENLDIAGVMDLLEKHSGLLGVSGVSLDTRVLMRTYDTDPRVKLAIEMFAYRVRKAVGAYLAALGGADAVIFGGGIAENTVLVRQRICEGLAWWGLTMDPEQNRTVIDREGPLSAADSRLQAWIIPVEETLQIAHECAVALGS